MLHAHLAAVAVKDVVVLVLHVRDAVAVDQDVLMYAMDVAAVWGVLQLVWRAASMLVTDLVRDLVAVVAQGALVAAVVVVVAVVQVHAKDVRPAVHVQTYVQADAPDRVMRDAAAAVSRPACPRVRVHVLRPAQDSPQYQLLLIKGR